jgi:hypothetical protein
MAYINRDPFARTELHRRVVNSHTFMQIECSWCGQPRLGKPKTLFQFYTETDAGRQHVHKGLFCSKSCHDSYHG